jgi:methanethiol oxidase
MNRALLCCLAILLSAGHAAAETCLSPFVKRLDRPEKFLYVF